MLSQTRSLPAAKAATAAQRDILRQEDNHQAVKHIFEQKAIVAALRVLEREARQGLCHAV